MIRPVKQKKRKFTLDKVEVIKQEIKKFLKADFIREMYYPNWLSNVVIVKKANGKWRMCVDFTNLNKACPKDSFPFFSIDRLVDASAGHHVLSFIDAFSGYNQIMIDLINQEKIMFIIE